MVSICNTEKPRVSNTFRGEKKNKTCFVETRFLTEKKLVSWRKKNKKNSFRSNSFRGEKKKLVSWRLVSWRKKKLVSWQKKKLVSWYSRGFDHEFRDRRTLYFFTNFNFYFSSGLPPYFNILVARNTILD